MPPRGEQTAITARSESIAAVLDGFRAGRAAEVAVVRGWIGAVLYGGNWRFADAEAVGQEVLVKLVRLARDDRIADPGSFQKFVYSVARNTCVSVYHRERTRARHEGPPEQAAAVADSTSPQADLERRERFELAASIVQRLPERCRDLWDRVYRRKQAAETAARELGITVNNLRVRLHRCLQRARGLYEELTRNPAPSATASTRDE